MALHAQLLDGRRKFPRGREGVARMIETLGYVQIDTIAVVERAHHHTIWNRRRDYRPEMLHDLQAKDRRVFEYWGHALSLLPTADYRFYLPRMKAAYDPNTKWEKDRDKKYGKFMKPILERIRTEGPLGSRDFENPPRGKRPKFWGPSPMKYALDMLWSRGDLMITERRKFGRIYDLTERVLPPDVDTRMPTTDEVGRFFVRRALQAFGLAQEAEIDDHIRATDKETLREALRELVANGDVVEVSIRELDNGTYYAFPETIETVGKLRRKTPRLHLLSPFDNFVIQRARIKKLFNFDYTIECYVPAPKRKHGYFVLPILWDERLVGRLDPKADRKTKTLQVKRLVLEDDFSPNDAFLEGLAAGLRDFAGFNGCESIAVESAQPVFLKKELQKAMRTG